jgi:hypothetical protein
MLPWLVACGGAPIPVGATLSEGQVLVGAVATPTLTLAGALGEIVVPLDDVGMLAPVEGATLGESHGNVVLWLKNGSELRGRWTEPDLDMTLRVGGRDVDVVVPTDRLQTLQLRGSEQWPDDGLFRVRTTHGDDFLVDPATTLLHLKNDLGAFEITLAECASVAPVGATDGSWRLVLHTGTVLVGAMEEDAVTFALPMGPERVEVPLASLVSLNRSVWSDHAGAKVAYGDAAEPTPPHPQASAPAPSRPVQGGLRSDEGWFANDRMYEAKH